MNLCLSPYREIFDCGHCRSCRLKKRAEWANRLQDEASVSELKTALFIMLSYKKEFLPNDYSIHKEHLQKFFKRLRRGLDRQYKKKKLSPPKIKYFACGEYGGEKGRPHYHAIIVGLNMTHADLIYKSWGMCEPQSFGCSLVKSKKGYAYVVGDASKKLGINYNKRFREQNNKTPEFQLQSIGIGKKYIMSIAENVRRKLTMRRNGRNVIPPRYYRKILGITAEQLGPLIEEYTSKVKQAVSSLAGYPIDERENEYYTKLKMLRKQNDLEIKEREKKWRHQHAIFAT
jgi:hypothetical protein